MPRPPGFVSEMFAPVRSSAVSALSRAFWMSSSNAALNSLKLLRPASRMTGTMSVRVPSFFSTSTAMPRFTAPSSTRSGLPSDWAKWCAMTGMSFCAATAIA